MSADGDWIVIPDWDRFQHYKDRNPPWLKIYTELLHDDEWLTLPPRARSLLCGLWLLYASSRRALRAHTGRLSRALNQQVTRSDLERLYEAGFIDFSASKPLAPCLQPASKTLASRAPARSQEAEAETEEPLTQPSVKPTTVPLPEQPPPLDSNGQPPQSRNGTPAHEHGNDLTPLDPHTILHQAGEPT